MKNGVTIAQYTSAIAVDHTRTNAVFRSNYTINSFHTNDIGTYACTVSNAIGSDTHSFNVDNHVITGKFLIRTA